MNLIGIGGTNGSGKDSLSEFLRSDYGWFFISASGDLIIPELQKRGLPLEREQMAALTAEWNRQISPGALVDKAVEKFKEVNQGQNYNGLVVSSIRHPAEADKIHGYGGKLVWLDSDPRVRYDRIYSRGQGDKDKKTFEQFLAEEQREMTHAGDEATLNMSGVKAKADIFITNDSNDLAKFKEIVKQKLGL